MRVNNVNAVFPKIFEEAIDSLFNTSLSDIIGNDFSLNTPSVNVIENDDHFEIQLAAPGFEKGDFNLEIEKDQLKISSDKEEAEQTEGKTFKRREFNYSKFTRSFQLPEAVDKESISAEYKNGILSVKLSKHDKAIDKGPKKIKIS